MEIWLDILHGQYLKVKKTRGNEDARERDTTNSSALPLMQVWEIKGEEEVEIQRSAC